MIYLQEHSI